MAEKKIAPKKPAAKAAPKETKEAATRVTKKKAKSFKKR